MGLLFYVCFCKTIVQQIKTYVYIQQSVLPFLFFIWLNMDFYRDLQLIDKDPKIIHLK